MATKAGLTDLSPSALKNVKFLEVLECPWRSEKVLFLFPSAPRIQVINSYLQLTNVSHTMQAMFSESQTTRERAHFHYKRVTGTHRKSSRIPLVAPWDFGVHREWLDEHCEDPNIGPLIADWGTHGNPEGFGPPVQKNAEPVEVPVDARFDFQALDANSAEAA